MALIQNPNFRGTLAEQTIAPWAKLNLPNSVTYDIVTGDVGQSGPTYLRVSTTAAGGSIAQDVQAGNVFSITSFAQLRAGGPDVAGALSIWNLSVDPNTGISTGFTVGRDWKLVFNAGSVSRFGTVRIELYILTPNADLYVDYINAV